MDITKFNKMLKSKVTVAKSYEKRNEIDSAITLWLEISEMTLNFSKSRSIDTTYRNMLITRTKNIVEHIKNLKAGQLEEELFVEEDYIHDEAIQEKISPKITENNKIASHEFEIKKTVKIESNHNPTKIIEKSEFKDLQEGFKEVKPSKDFKIITPHDENFVEKRLSQETDIALPKNQKEVNLDQSQQQRQERFEFEQPVNNDKLICFACGYDKNAKDAQTCGSCGTKLN